MKKLLVFLGIFFLTGVTVAQDYDPNRYRESIFDGTLSITDVNYGEAPQWIWPYWDVDLNLDVYVPDGDLNPKRPLIIFAHAGGFLTGSKEVDNMVAICDSFARKGYVTASIDYRKGFDPLDGASAERAVYRAVQDGKAAVRYFKQNASLYDIDTNNIFFAGMSAGGYISLHVAYMDKESERPESSYGGGPVNDLLCLDCAGNDFPHTSEVRAIIDFWGGVDDTTIIEEGDIPVLIMHGENDETVPFEYGHPFGLFTLPETYGGLPISERVHNLGIPYELHTSTGPLHMLDGSDNGDFPVEGPNSFWSDTLLPNSERFLYEIIKPHTVRISDDSTEICFGSTLMLQVSDSASSHYIWDFDEAAIDVVTDDNSGEIELEFNTAGTFEITVVEFNDILCAGDTILFTVTVADEIITDFDFSITDFNNVAFTNTSEGGVFYNWDFGDGEGSSEENPTHIYEENGTYEVILYVMNELGCTDTLITSIDITGLGLDDFGASELTLYPNPFEDVITLSTEHEIATIFVTDAVGRVVYSESNPSFYGVHEIDASEWTSGLYFVSVQNSSGQIYSQKLIKN